MKELAGSIQCSVLKSSVKYNFIMLGNLYHIPASMKIDRFVSIYQKQLLEVKIDVIDGL